MSEQSNKLSLIYFLKASMAQSWTKKYKKKKKKKKYTMPQKKKKKKKRKTKWRVKNQENKVI